MAKPVIVEYEHHGGIVKVDARHKGRHREHCLCYHCDSFKPGEPDQCPIAQAIYENCVKFNVVTPVWECPEYQAKPDDTVFNRTAEEMGVVPE